MCYSYDLDIKTKKIIIFTIIFLSIEDYDWNVESRGMKDYDHIDMKEMPEQKAIKNDPWTGYYDFIINEGSFKFWAAFQVYNRFIVKGIDFKLICFSSQRLYC